MDSNSIDELVVIHEQILHDKFLKKHFNESFVRRGVYERLEKQYDFSNENLGGLINISEVSSGNKLYYVGMDIKDTYYNQTLRRYEDLPIIWMADLFCITRYMLYHGDYTVPLDEIENIYSEKQLFGVKIHFVSSDGTDSAISTKVSKKDIDVYTKALSYYVKLVREKTKRNLSSDSGGAIEQGTVPLFDYVRSLFAQMNKSLPVGFCSFEEAAFKAKLDKGTKIIRLSSFDERVLYVYDDTVLGSMKAGFIVSDKRVYNTKEKTVVQLNKIRSVVYTANRVSIEMDDNQIFCSYSMASLEKAAAFATLLTGTIENILKCNIEFENVNDVCRYKISPTQGNTGNDQMSFKEAFNVYTEELNQIKEIQYNDRNGVNDGADNNDQQTDFSADAELLDGSRETSEPIKMTPDLYKKLKSERKLQVQRGEVFATFAESVNKEQIITELCVSCNLNSIRGANIETIKRLIRVYTGKSEQEANAIVSGKFPCKVLTNSCFDLVEDFIDDIESAGGKASWGIGEGPVEPIRTVRLPGEPKQHTENSGDTICRFNKEAKLNKVSLIRVLREFGGLDVVAAKDIADKAPGEVDLTEYGFSVQNAKNCIRDLERKGWVDSVSSTSGDDFKSDGASEVLEQSESELMSIPQGNADAASIEHEQNNSGTCVTFYRNLTESEKFVVSLILRIHGIDDGKTKEMLDSIPISVDLCQYGVSEEEARTCVEALIKKDLVKNG